MKGRKMNPPRFSNLSLSPLFILVTLFLSIDFAHGFSSKSEIDSPLLTEVIASNQTITVDAEGNGDFKTVQAAIDYVPKGNANWIIIHVHKGIYREKVSIPRNKPYIFLRGEGKGKTSIVWSQSSNDDYESATFKVEAARFVAFGISFKNNAPTLSTHTLNTKSVAVVVGGDKAAFYQCGFFSNHNTLFDHNGKHYYDKCYIQGSVDFIFGRGQAIFHDCELFVLRNWKTEVGGSITAHDRNSRKENSGFVFLKGSVYGIGNVYLGRPKAAHSRVIFANTYMSKSVIPHGWTNFSYEGLTHNLYHAEHKCHGPGADSTSRASWSKQLKDEEAAPFLTIDFIKGKQWLPAWFF